MKYLIPILILLLTGCNELNVPWKVSHVQTTDPSALRTFTRTCLEIPNRSVTVRIAGKVQVERKYTFPYKPQMTEVTATCWEGTHLSNHNQEDP